MPRVLPACAFCTQTGRLIALHSGFLQTPPRDDALLSRRSPAEGACLRLVLSLPLSNDGTGLIYRGLSPHKFTPMPGVHRKLLAQVAGGVLWIIKLLAPPDKKPKYIFHNIYLDTFCRWYILLSINQ